MSNVSDISRKLLNEFYNNHKEFNEEFLFEGGIPSPLLKAYQNSRTDAETQLDKYMQRKSTVAPSYLDSGTKSLYVDKARNAWSDGISASPINRNKDYRRSYLQGKNNRVSGVEVPDYGKVTYTSMSKPEALRDLNLNISLNKTPWELNLNNMPENPKEIKITCSNVQDTREKIKDYRFVSTENNTYVQFMYIEEKDKIIPIIRGKLTSFTRSMYKFNYRGNMFNSRLSENEFRPDYIANQFESIFWVIVFSDFIFKTNESKMLAPSGDRLQDLTKRKSEYSTSFITGNANDKGVNYYNYNGSAEQRQNMNRYTPFSSITQNIEKEIIYNKKDTGYHLNRNDFNSNTDLQMFYDYNDSKNKMLKYQYKLKQLIDSKQYYIDNDIENLFDERLKKYKELVKNSISEYKRMKDEYKTFIANSYKLISDTNYKFKAKVLKYYESIEEIYKEIKKVADELNSLQFLNFKDIQKQFGLDSGDLQKNLTEIKEKIQNYIKEKQLLQQKLEERRRKIEELQHQLQEQQNAIENDELNMQNAENNLNSLNSKKEEIEEEINSDTKAVKEFYKKRIELTDKGNELQNQIERMKDEVKNGNKDLNVINYTKKSIPKQEDKERILNVLSGLSSLSSGLTTTKEVDLNSEDFDLTED